MNGTSKLYTFCSASFSLCPMKGEQDNLLEDMYGMWIDCGLWIMICDVSSSIWVKLNNITIQSWCEGSSSDIAVNRALV